MREKSKLIGQETEVVDAYFSGKSTLEIGKIFNVSPASIQRCLKMRNISCRKSERKDLTGQVFGRLTAIRDVGVGDNHTRLWFCKCSCGNTKEIPTNRLIGGNTQSCGCLKFKDFCKRGHALTPENRTPRGRCKECTTMRVAAYNEEYNKKHPDFRKNYHLQTTFNLSRDTYDRMSHNQKGRCVICRDIMNQPHVDHDHACCPGKKSCGKCIRALLCGACNRALGLLRDDIMTAENLVAYLKKWKSCPA